MHYHTPLLWDIVNSAVGTRHRDQIELINSQTEMQPPSPCQGTRHEARH